MQKLISQSYFETLKEFETSELFLTERTDLIDSEIYENCIAIGLEYEVAEHITIKDLESFLSRVKQNRQDQLNKSDLKINLIYYIWFSEMAGQLCFNFINANHDRLPFRCELSFVSSEREILERFLTSHYLEGIPHEEFTAVDEDSKSINYEPVPYVLNIYQEIIKRSAH